MLWHSHFLSIPVGILCNFFVNSLGCVVLAQTVVRLFAREGHCGSQSVEWAPSILYIEKLNS